MKSTNSAFALRLERHAKLTDAERRILEELEAAPERRRKRASVFDPGNTNARLAIIRSGWAITRASSPKGQSTITQVHMPGDLIGLTDIAYPSPPHDVVMQTEGTVHLVDRAVLTRIGNEHPRLMTLFLSMASIEEIALRDRLHTITRLTAEERLIHFMLSISSRTTQISEQPSDRFPLHMSQKDIGDALGLTDIYVNRLMRKLAREGEMDVSRPYVRITNRDAWTKRVAFQDRWNGIDTSWIARAS